MKTNIFLTLNQVGAAEMNKLLIHLENVQFLHPDDISVMFSCKLTNQMP